MLNTHNLGNGPGKKVCHVSKSHVSCEFNKLAFYVHIVRDLEGPAGLQRNVSWENKPGESSEFTSKESGWQEVSLGQDWIWK